MDPLLHIRQHGAFLAEEEPDFDVYLDTDPACENREFPGGELPEEQQEPKLKRRSKKRGKIVKEET